MICVTYMILKLQNVDLHVSKVKFQLTDTPNSFCNCINIDTGINDFHNLKGVISKVHATQSSKHLIGPDRYI